MSRTGEGGSAAVAGRGLSGALWTVQSLLAVTFVGTGLWKLLTPLPKLAGMIPWAGQVSPGLLYFTAVVDLCGGVGVILPAATRIKPGVVVWAAAGCAVLQVCAIGFHVMRGEAGKTWFNAALVVMAVFVAWGRGRAALAPR